MRLLQIRFAPLSGLILAAAVFTGAAFAQTGLTTIQDTLFKADGTRFTGTLYILWSTFDATNIGTIVQQSKSVDVVNGNLMAQLVPNAGQAAPANTYTVQYQSDGNQQFTETWTVPSSSAPLTVAEVRTGMLTSSSGTPAGNQTTIPEAGVIGLTSDLAQRPVKGPGFGAGSVAVIDQNGQIETAVGDIGDCVYIDGTAGPCGGPQAQFFDAETPGGLVDGNNVTFLLANPPSGSSLMLFRNGMFMKSGFDYTMTGSTIQFLAGAPQPGDTLVANYRLDPSASNVLNLTASAGFTRASVMAQVLCSANGQSNNTNTFQSLGRCDIPSAGLKPGDRIEIRFNFSHTGTGSGFDMTVNWGSTKILARSGGRQDAAVAGQAEAAIGASGSQITVQSWGTLLAFLPGIVSSPAQNGLTVDIEGRISNPGSDALTLASFTVLRYPGN